MSTVKKTGRTSTKTEMVVLCVAFFVVSVIAEGCAFSQGVGPEKGACRGPEERTAAKRSSVTSVNHGCGLNEVFFAQGEGVACGTCPPGSVLTQRQLETGLRPNSTDGFATSSQFCNEEVSFLFSSLLVCSSFFLSPSSSSKTNPKARPVLWSLTLRGGRQHADAPWILSFARVLFSRW